MRLKLIILFAIASLYITWGIGLLFGLFYITPQWMNILQ